MTGSSGNGSRRCSQRCSPLSDSNTCKPERRLQVGRGLEVCSACPIRGSLQDFDSYLKTLTPTQRCLEAGTSQEPAVGEQGLLPPQELGSCWILLLRPLGSCQFSWPGPQLHWWWESPDLPHSVKKLWFNPILKKYRNLHFSKYGSLWNCNKTRYY